MNICGQKYGQLTVLKLDRTDKHCHKYWRVRCDCGTTTVVRQNDLWSGHTSSCGCLRKEINKEGRYALKHGDNANGVVAKEYRAWQNLKQRCLDSNDISYDYYGGRGITVCKRWLHSYQNFLKDVGRAPGPEFSIDRINNNGNYTPRNVRWATASEQRNNQRAEGKCQSL